MAAKLTILSGQGKSTPTSILGDLPKQSATAAPELGDGYGSFLIERPGGMTPDGGLLTILNGANPTGDKTDYGIGLDFYNGHGQRMNIDQYMVKGEKGYYNLAAIAKQTDYKMYDDPTLASKYVKGDPIAQKAIEDHIAERQKDFLEHAKDKMPIGADVTKKPEWMKFSEEAKGSWSQDPVYKFKTNNQLNGMGGSMKPVTGSMWETERPLEMGPTEGKQNIKLQPNISHTVSELSYLHDMPTFISNDDIKSGAAQGAMVDRTRKSIGKPTGGYGRPVFNLLSGAPPTDTLLGA